ncbi:hypothetical protein EN916_20360 [Mesorhizobium sp. M7A.F.Ca.CA.001.11.2.1]|nr:hypothetical protein EN916_20360 [Mesorhizobium sp. M7A.F.Ca.CA.001.11.2.1]
MAPRHPPLACRPSPPQGGRLAIVLGFATLQRCRTSATRKLPISPSRGEMPGKAEGGVGPQTNDNWRPF